MAKMQPGDPAYWMILDDFTSTPNPDIFNDSCYICLDPEFAQMGLPLCTACLLCGEHTPADDSVCDTGHDQLDLLNAPQGEISARSETCLLVP